MIGRIVEQLEPRRLFANAASLPQELFDAGGMLLFSAHDGVNGRELWKSDGTAAGTVLVKDLTPGAVGSNPRDLVSVGGVTYFFADNEFRDPQLWRTDGTTAGTQLIADLRTISGREIDTLSMAVLDDQLIINATLHRQSYHALIRSDGTTGGTTRIAEFGGSIFKLLGPVNGSMLFVAEDATHGEELWKTDGTSAGTVLLKDINPGAGDAFIGDLFAVRDAGAQDELFFNASANTGGGLWKTDGTAAGTVRVSDVDPAGSLIIFNGAVYFSVNSPDANVRGLWKSDGAPGGTTARISPRFATDFVVAGQTLFFNSHDLTQGTELWKTDGTAAGTVLVKDIFPGERSSRPRAHVVRGNEIYFFATASEFSGGRLFKSDGTAAGTVAITDEVPFLGEEASFATDLALVNGTLFFAASDGDHFVELWRSDGTPGGATFVKDINLTEMPLLHFRPSSRNPYWEIFGTAADDAFTLTTSGEFVVVTTGTGKRETFVLQANQFVLISANDGNDTVDVSAVSFPRLVVDGGRGDDSIRGGGGNETLAAFDGNDTIFGGGGDDRVDGGVGDDSLWGEEGNDVLIGWIGVDSLYGNGGNDTLEGGANSDHMRGNGGRDKMFGDGGNDRMYGGSSGDFIYGFAGNDQILGEGGNDRLYGDDGDADTLTGGAGNDVFITRDGVIDHLFGDGGDDTAIADEKDVLTSILRAP